MNYTEVEIRRYQWEAPFPPSEFLGQLRAIIRDERRICGVVFSPTFRIRTGRTPTGFRRSWYEGSVTAVDGGCQITATMKPSSAVRASLAVSAGVVPVGALLLATGIGWLVLGHRTDQDLLLPGVGLGFMGGGVAINVLTRASYWLDAESMQEYLLGHFRRRVEFWRHERSGK